MSEREQHQLESLEERQWRLMMEQARARIGRGRSEWKRLLARAQSALENEEREWARLLERARLKSSGVFGTQRGESLPPARTSTSMICPRAEPPALTFARAPQSALRFELGRNRLFRPHSSSKAESAIETSSAVQNMVFCILAGGFLRVTWADTRRMVKPAL